MRAVEGICSVEGEGGVGRGEEWRVTKRIGDRGRLVRKEGRGREGDTGRGCEEEER